MQLHTYEGLGWSMPKPLKKLGTAVKKKTVATVKAPIRAAVQIKRGNVLQAAKAIAKPVPFATQAVNKAAKAGTQLKRGNVLKAGKLVNSAAFAPVKATAAIIGRNMPAPIKSAVKVAVTRAVGSKATAATKAIILPSATAAAFAVPGVQPFAIAVPVVVNEIIDQLIEAGKKTAAKVVKKTVATATAQKKASGQPAAPRSALAAKSAQGRAAELKQRMQAAKEKAGSTISEAAQAAQEAQQSPAEAAAMPDNKNRNLIIGGGVLLLIAGGYIVTRKKRG